MLTLNKGFWADEVAGGPPAFPSTSVIDDFNRSNEGPPPSASWGSTAIITGGGHVGIKVVSNELVDNGGNGSGWWGTSFNANQEVFAKVSSTNLSGASAFRLYVRLQSPGTATPDGYLCVYDAGGPTLSLRRMDDSVDSGNLNSASINLNSGSDRFGVRAYGTDIEVYYKQGAGAWTMAFTASDATYNASGHIGAYVSSGALDDFGGGNT